MKRFFNRNPLTPPEALKGALKGALWPYACGVGAILCWASLAAAVGQSLHQVPAEAILFYGLLTAGLTLGGWGWLKQGRFPLSWPGWRPALFGVYGIWGYHTLLVLALALAPDVEANILNYTWALWIVVFGSFLPGHRFSWRILLCAVVGFAGVVLVISGDALLSGGWEALAESARAAGAGEGGDTRMAGLMLALAAGVCWGSFTAFMRVAIPSRPGNMALFCLLAGITAGVFMWLRGVSPVVPWQHMGLVIYTGLVPLGLSFVLWEQAARGCNVQALGFMSFFTPVLSTALLAWVSGTEVGLSLGLGLSLIIGGALLGTLGNRA